MDIDNDEIRRQLRQAEADQREAMPRWQELLKRVFDPKSGVSSGEKAQLLGVPARRQFLKLGGATVLGGAILAACGSDNSSSGTTTTTAAGSTTTAASGDAAAMDLTLLRTASSLEVLAVNVYQTAIDSGKVTTKAVADAAKLFQSQHQEHADALEAATKNNGGEPYTKPNQYVNDNVVAKADLSSEEAIATFALELENLAAQTYVYAASVLSTPQFRQTIMTIGGVEARHAAILQSVLMPNDPTTWVEGENGFLQAKAPPKGAVIS